MQNTKLYLLLLTVAGFFNPLNAQNFEWLKTYGVSNSPRDGISGICAEPNGGCVFKFSIDSGFISTSAPIDTLYFDKYKFTVTDDFVNYLVRLDSNGKVVKVANIGTFVTASDEMSMDKEGNFYVTATLERTHTIGGVTMSRANGAIVYAKFDKDFNLVWAKQTGNVFNEGRQAFYYSQGHLYFIFSGSGNISIGGKNYSFSQVPSHVYGEINIADGEILWSDILYNRPSTGNPQFVVSEILKLKNKLYLSGYTFATVLVKGDTLFKGGFIVETDTIGNYKKRFSFKGKGDIYLLSMTTDGQHLYITGFFNDSLTWGKQNIIPEYPTGGYYQTREIYAASITTAFQPRWFFHPKVLDRNGIGSVGQKVKCSNGFFYFIGTIGAKILIDSTILSPSKYGKKEVIIYKSDSLGNILWVVSGGSTRNAEVSCMDALADKSVFVAGMFSGKITFGKFSDSSKNPSTTVDYQDSWLTKITDYSITRGQVKSGPYCTGDTIKIPYTKFGVFDSSNVFVAQMSDENGNFDKAIELGRLKSNKDGIIMGKLPSFQVVSSTLYRIRILSTNPKILSYYRTDTLRLLIYSKDKANPGPPETICMGDSIKLNTYGGTKWIWSPKYRMDDSTKRQPWAWPIKDTIYKIIIDDSSGCGKPDTAFKTIKVRAYPKARLAFADTVICDNSNLKVPVLFEGGDSNYTWRWYFVASPKLWFPSYSGNGKFADTFSFSPTVSKVAIILKDGCTAKADTAYLTISQRKPVTITSTYRDTTLCVGNLLKYKATATGGIPKMYRYQWKDLVTNSILSTTDSLKILTKKSLKIQLIVNDGCEALGDTAEFEVKVKAELKAISNLRDTTICEGKSMNYNAQATGGDSKTYTYSWVLNGKEISTSNILNLTSNILNLTSNLSLITKDNCSPNDTIKKTITVLPSPKSDFNWDLACSRTITKFKFTGTKPNSPITTTFHWNFNKEATSTLENPSHQFAKSGTSTSVLTLTSNNGCTDTLNKKIEVKVQAKAEFEVKDVCENQPALFTNQSQDATSYLWKFGDGQSSQTQDPKHNYTISTTTTYNVTLVAQVLNGCADSISKALTINQNPSSDFSYTYNGSKVDLKIAKGGNSYQWKFGTTDSAKTTATTYTHTIKSSDQHTVCLTATDLSSCSSQTCKNITVGILKLTEKSFKIFPNPNNGSFTVEMENPEIDAAIEVFDVMGKLVKKVERVGKVTLVDLDVESGIYLVKVRNGEEVWNQKMVVSY